MNNINKITGGSKKIDIQVSNVSKTFRLSNAIENSMFAYVLNFFNKKNKDEKYQYPQVIKALHEIHISFEQGSVVGIIGRNGSGKSTLLRVIAGIHSVDEGTITVNDTILYVSGFARGLKTKLTVRENIYLIGSIFGLSNTDIRSVYDEIIEFSGLQKFANAKLYQLSTGMLSRLAFSTFIYCVELLHPAILLFDEVIGAGGDLDFMNKANQKLGKLVQSGATVLFVSHNMNEIRKYCSSVIWLENGVIKKHGHSEEIVTEYIESKI